MRIIVLYEELAWYFVNCLNTLAEDHGCFITVFCKKTNADAPYQFKFVHNDIKIIDRSSLSSAEMQTMIRNLDPDFIFLGGWSYKAYLHLIKKMRKTVIVGFDNQWTGSPRQVLGAIYFRVALKKYIASAFVPGQRQHQFARKIGFGEANISTGAYCCDYSFFHREFERNKDQKTMAFPKRFLFAGRYSEEKGIRQLWTAFIELKEEVENEWELWCVGTGKIPPIKHPAIRHFGFVQPGDMSDIIAGTGVFVLPSFFEPWGVVVHEFASAGYPLICSDKVGATDSFLNPGQNGLIFKAGNYRALKESLRTAMNFTQENFNFMSVNSTRISSKLTPAIWGRNLIRLYNGN